MFLETICIIQGQAQALGDHQKRMQKTGRHFGFPAPKLPDLNAQVPHHLKDQKVKCTVTYHKEIVQTTYSAYHKANISSLKVIASALPDYAFKYADRTALHDLRQKREDCDEIILVCRGHIADTSFTNLVFEKDGTFFTPTTYLLNGTKRQRLLQEGRIQEKVITVKDLHLYDRVHLINAMMSLEDGISLNVNKIRL